MSIALDVTIVSLVAGMAWSGARRGFVFYAIDLVGFAFAVIIAIRYHDRVAEIFLLFGWSRTRANVAGGLTLFLIIITMTTIVGTFVASAVYKPGLFMTNRALGAAFGGALALTIVVVGLLFLKSVSFRPANDLVDRSFVARPLIAAATPVVSSLNGRVGLDLCSRKLFSQLPAACDRATSSDETNVSPRPSTGTQTPGSDTATAGAHVR